MDVGRLADTTLLQGNALARASSDFDAVQRAVHAEDPTAAAHEFEALLARVLVREMRRGVSTGLFGSGAGADTYEGWFDEHLGEALADRDALGLSGMVKVALGRAARVDPGMPEERGSPQ